MLSASAAHEAAGIFQPQCAGAAGRLCARAWARRAL